MKIAIAIIEIIELLVILGFSVYTVITFNKISKNHKSMAKNREELNKLYDKWSDYDSLYGTKLGRKIK